MFMFPAPTPKNYRLRHANLNTVSAELHSPDGYPRCTQTTVGLYSFPLKNTCEEYKIRKVNDTILDRWTNASRAWWIGKPGEDAQFMFDMHMATKDEKELDPRFMLKSSLFPRSYQYEMDCIETRRLQKLFNKMEKDEEDRVKKKEAHGVAPCICTDEEKDTSEKESKSDEEHDASRWQKPPDVFGKSQEDPCKRREEFQKYGQTYQTEACRFYYEKYPPPPLSKHLKRFAK